jgi:AcrR family transcriptional regulator
MTTKISTQKRSSPSVTASRRPRKRLTREELAPDAREKIFRAAAKVVGEYGYANASINRITEAAGIAQGTFYLYFESRQALFDELLPHVGTDMLHFIRDHVAGSKNVHHMEERAFRAFFKYLEGNPGFFRVLNEAEIAAPVAHRKHFALLTEHYVESLERGIEAGEIRNFDREDLESIAYMLMAARSYLHLRYIKGNHGRRTLPEKVVKTYMKFVREGLR